MEAVGREGGARLGSTPYASPKLDGNVRHCHWMPVKDLRQDGTIVIISLKKVFICGMNE